MRDLKLAITETGRNKENVRVLALHLAAVVWPFRVSSRVVPAGHSLLARFSAAGCVVPLQSPCHGHWRQIRARRSVWCFSLLQPAARACALSAARVWDSRSYAGSRERWVVLCAEGRLRVRWWKENVQVMAAHLSRLASLRSSTEIAMADVPLEGGGVAVQVCVPFAAVRGSGDEIAALPLPLGAAFALGAPQATVAAAGRPVQRRRALRVDNRQDSLRPVRRRGRTRGVS